MDVTVAIGEGQQHVYPFLAGRSELVDQELSRISNWYHQGR
ncbi:hypothetical protein [Pseudarthrobacter sulfonivorans]|nr:hypothetical protein [Pseudarthrobacter sulfonivorans]